MVGTDVITVAQPPAVNWGPNTVICQGSSITAQAVPQNAAYQYRWLRNGTLVPGQTGSTLSISQTGQYRVEINNGNGCFVASAPQTIEVRNAPLANFGLRVAGPMHLQVTDSSQLADTYLWQFDNGQTATLASPPIQEYATNGLKTIQLSITGCGGQTQVVSRQVLLGFDELRSQAVQWGTHENLQYTGNACLNEARFTQNPQSRHLLAVGSQFATEGTMEWRFWASRGYNASNPNDTTIIYLAGNAAGPVSQGMFQLILNNSTRQAILRIRTGPSSTNNYMVNLSSQTPSFFNRWIAVGITYGASGMQFRVDGVTYTFGTPVVIPLGGPPLINGTPNYVSTGRHWDMQLNTQVGFEGWVDKIRVSNLHASFLLQSTVPAYQSAATGPWHNPATWRGPYLVPPGSCDSVIIAAGHTVTISQPSQVRVLQVRAQGNATTTGAGSLLIRKPEEE